MTTKAIEAYAPASRGEHAPALTSQSGSPEIPRSRNNAVLKSGPLYISSKGGIGWTSWKKRWFILTHTSLVFFRSDPSAPLRNGEVNLTLGGIDLNNTGSVEVKPEKKLLTVLFPDGRDGRAFTLKAETTEDLYEWKLALESALALAPSAIAPTGQNGILRNDQGEVVNGPSDQQKDKLPVKSMVIGRPILLALEDFDGTPSFLEKALKFIEDQGVKTEGILRQAADVEEVERRVREYEQGKSEFSPKEDAHVIADCIKHVLRELPSPPVPASCCNALLQALRSDQTNRVNAMRDAVLETFPEPNRCLLQRILMMMRAVASHKDENRMSVSAVAACMSPLLLRPLLAGDCEVENENFDVAGDGSFQLLQAAAAANHAQAIIVTLLEEYEYIFGKGAVSPELFSDTEENGMESEEDTDEDDMYDEHDDEGCGSEEYEGTDEEYEHSISETSSDDEDNADDTDNTDDESYDDKHGGGSSLVPKSPEIDHSYESILWSTSASSQISRPDHDNVQDTADKFLERKNYAEAKVDHAGELQRDFAAAATRNEPFVQSPSSSIQNPEVYSRVRANKNPSMESTDFSFDDEDEIKRLDVVKKNLQNQIAEEANENDILQASLEKRKKVLNERRLALEREVNRLQEQLQREKERRTTMKAELEVSSWVFSGNVDEKTKTELEKIALIEENLSSLKQRVDDLGAQEAPTQGTVLGSKQKDDGMRSSSHLEKSTAVDAADARPTPSTSFRQPSSKGEVSNSTTSGLSTLSTRLNFLKGRTQLASELQDMDHSPNQAKDKGSKSQQSNRNTDTRRENSGHQPLSNAQHVAVTDGCGGGCLDQCSEGGNKNSYTGKTECLSIQSSDVVKKPGGQSTQHIDTIKSDSQSARKSDKSRQSEGTYRYKRYGL